MKIIIYGASGMVGQAALCACLNDAGVEQILTVGRTALNQTDPKLLQLIQPDISVYTNAGTALAGYDACFFCLGVTSTGLSEIGYSKLTYDLTLGIAETLSRLNPNMVFIYVSGAGTDSSETGRVMWARIKGRTENALQRLPFKAVYLFRPGVIQPLHGIRSKTKSYRMFYDIAGPVLSLIRHFAPRMILTTDIIGRAMIKVSRDPASQPILEARDIYLKGQ